MSEELWVFVDEDIKSEVEDKYKNKIKSIKSPLEGTSGKNYDYINLFGWSGSERLRYEHAYEAPWKSGWAYFIINGRKKEVKWNTIKDEIKVTIVGGLK